MLLHPSGVFFSVWTVVMVKVSHRRASMFNSDSYFTLMGPRDSKIFAKWFGNSL